MSQLSCKNEFKQKILGKLFQTTIFILIGAIALSTRASAPKIDFNEIVDWNQTTLEQMIYVISEEEGFDKPQLLIALARHESIFLKKPKILDTNNKWSLGLYHWQRDSFDDYCIDRYNLPDDIMGPVTQTKCSIRAIKDGYFEDLWVNSSKKIKKGL